MRLTSWCGFITLQVLSAITVAQEEPWCKFGDKYVNATGITPFRFDSQQDDWYSSLSFSYPYRTTEAAAEQASIGGVLSLFKTFLSVPKNTKAELCQWSFDYLNATATGPGLNGCQGLLSQECVDRLRDLAINSPAAKCSGFEFPSEWHREARDVCGDDLFGGPPDWVEQSDDPTAFIALARKSEPCVWLSRVLSFKILAFEYFFVLPVGEYANANSSS